MFRTGVQGLISVFLGVAITCSSLASAQHRTTSQYGTRNDPFHGGKRMHNGEDMAARTGTPVYATGDGVVLRSRMAGGYGNLVEIAHGYGYVSRYAHLSELSVPEGAIVRRGQMVGRVGSTGRSTGPHLHYEVRINGKSVNPDRFMQIVFSEPVNLIQLAANLRRGNVPAAQAPSAPTGTVVAAAPQKAPRTRVRGSIDIENYFEIGEGAEPADNGFAAGHVSSGSPR